MKKGCIHAVLPTHSVAETLQQRLQRQQKSANLNRTQKSDFSKLRALKCPEIILALMKDKTHLLLTNIFGCVRMCV